MDEEPYCTTTGLTSLRDGENHAMYDWKLQSSDDEWEVELNVCNTLHEVTLIVIAHSGNVQATIWILQKLLNVQVFYCTILTSLDTVGNNMPNQSQHYFHSSVST